MAFRLEHLIDPVAAAMRQASETAILPRYRHLGVHEIEEKSAGEVVTQADRESEAILTPILRSLVEGARVVGEEAAEANPELLRGLDEGLVWLVDPLDGTGNFANGSGAFAVMVGLMEHGQTRACWILDPLTGWEFFAGKGLGATKNGQQIKKSAPNDEVVRASDMRGAILSRFLPADIRSRVEQGRKLLHATSGMFCAGAEYPAIALGQQDFALFWRTLPWDHAPGALFLSEAGGHVARPDGGAYLPSDGRSGLLAARSQVIWTEVHKALLT